MTEHRQVAILDPTSKAMIEVDELMAPLLQAIWSHGIITSNSCQENRPGVMWIEFFSAEDVESFLTCIVSGLDPINNPKADNWLYSRIKGSSEGWQYAAHPHDVREYIDPDCGTIELNPSQSCGFILSISVRFPKSDYERLCDLLGAKPRSSI